jgi:hypothetical protein
VPVRKCFVMHVNNEYVKKGAVNPQGFFTTVDVTADVQEVTPGIGERIGDMLAVIASPKCPATGIGPQCTDPYVCPLMDKCWRHVNAEENSIFTLHRMNSGKRWDLYRGGVLRNDQIPDGYQVSAAQRIQLDAERTGRMHFDREVVSDFLSKLRYPLHFLDFETFQTAIPLVDGTRPYQQIPFQFSLHVLRDARSAAEHHSWLWDAQGQPHALMLGRLCDLIGARGSVVSYNAPFERSRLNEAAALFPEHAKWVKGVLGRVVDLWEPFRSFAVYHPRQHGSASIKSVLPALTGRGYDDLAISNGGQAGGEFLRVTFGEATPQERNEVHRQLEAYCGRDTMGMVQIVAKLGKLAG